MPVNRVYGECKSASQGERDIRKVILSSRENASGVSRDRSIAFEVVRKLLPSTSSLFGGVFRIANAESLVILTRCLESDDFSALCNPTPGRFLPSTSLPSFTSWLEKQGFKVPDAASITDNLQCENVEEFKENLTKDDIDQCAAALKLRKPIKNKLSKLYDEAIKGTSQIMPQRKNSISEVAINGRIFVWIDIQVGRVAKPCNFLAPFSCSLLAQACTYA